MRVFNGIKGIMFVISWTINFVSILVSKSIKDFELYSISRFFDSFDSIKLFFKWLVKTLLDLFRFI